MGKYVIHPLVLGSKRFDKGMMTYQHGYGEPYVIPIYAWLITGGDSAILVDSGEMSPIRSEDRQKALGAPILTLEEALAKKGMAPTDIDVVIHTHLHNDHCENDYKLENAQFFVHELEMEHVHNPHPLDFRYLDDYICDVEEAGQIKTLDGDAEIVPGIEVMHTPAHTAGGMSVCVDTEQGKAVITGFCVIAENFNPPREVRAMDMEVIPPGTHINVNDAYDIMLKVRDKADIIIPLHEPSFARRETIPW